MCGKLEGRYPVGEKPHPIFAYLFRLWAQFDYTHPNGSVSQIWRQVTQKVPLIKLMINREKRMIKRESNDNQCSSMVFSSLKLKVCVMNEKSRTKSEV